MYLSISLFFRTTNDAKKGGTFLRCNKLQPSSLTFSGKEKKFKNSLKQHMYLDCFHLHFRYLCSSNFSSFAWSSKFDFSSIVGILQLCGQNSREEMVFEKENPNVGETHHATYLPIVCYSFTHSFIHSFIHFQSSDLFCTTRGYVEKKIHIWITRTYIWANLLTLALTLSCLFWIASLWWFFPVWKKNFIHWGIF